MEIFEKRADSLERRKKPETSMGERTIVAGLDE